MCMCLIVKVLKVESRRRSTEMGCLGVCLKLVFVGVCSVCLEVDMYVNKENDVMGRK